MPPANTASPAIRPGILLHPGGGGAQYPHRFKPFRPRNLWRRTPGPRPPKSPFNLKAAVIAFGLFLVIALVVAAAVTGVFGLLDNTPRDERYAEWAIEAGFEIEQNLIGRNLRTIRGEFSGVRAVIVVPRSDTQFPVLVNQFQQFSEVENAVIWLNAGSSWEALESEGALVICRPVIECSALAEALAAAVLSD